MSARKDDPFFELLAYLVSAAATTVEEAPRYGSLRLLVGASRLVDAIEASGGAVDETAKAWKHSIDENIWNVMNEYPTYQAWLGELVGEVATEARRRNVKS